MQNSKNLIIVILLVAVVVMGVLLYRGKSVLPTQDENGQVSVQTDAKSDDQDDVVNPEIATQPIANSYTSEKYAFSFKIPEGFTIDMEKRKMEGQKPSTYFEAQGPDNDVEKLIVGEAVTIIKDGEREEFEKELEKLRQQGVTDMGGPIFHDTGVYFYKQPFEDIFQYVIGFLNEEQSKEVWKDVEVSGKKGKSVFLSGYGNVKISLFDLGEYTLVIEEEDPLAEDDRISTVTLEIMNTFKFSN